MDHDTFFATAAQVIPIMFLALALQLRLFGGQASEQRAWAVAGPVSALIWMAGMAIGEAIALSSLAGNTDSETRRELVGIALLVGGTGLIYPFFELEYRQLRKGVSPRRHRVLDHAARGVFFAPVVVGAFWILFI